MYDTPAIYSPATEHADDISLLLRQFLFKSSSSSSSFSPFNSGSTQMKCEIQPLHPSGLSATALSSTAGDNIPVNVVGHVASSSIGAIDYDPDEHDSESEEGLERLVEEMAANPNPNPNPNPPPRNPSKRTRAAEVHNMSEKRRRSRINEKMKALQKLIPNSNKTDKASMLDEAIEYLKQLQLQVQMLTMRHGINLYSMCAPHQPNPRPSGIMNHGNPSINITANYGTIVNPWLSQNQPSLLDFSRTINQDPSFGTRLGSS
ncbi:hypothetical protein R6Q59_034734 [Mikania micrantha]|uniref:BHLH domain-containing protein n=1 Tax=Mikania micrantha TaxID=192012 RepID=A0A5N6NGJ2_9ASTR|nr:hypothetical protein E3N88_20245 [Mikania micrantha]